MKLEKRIKDIEQRNKRVELDKTGETSKTRKICIIMCGTWNKCNHNM